MQMVDKEVIQQKINIIDNNLSKMQILARLPEEEFLNKFFYIEAAKHLLQVSIEAMLDVSNHIIARKRFRSPKTYAEVFSILVEQKILPKEKEKNFMQMAKFRNRVVHLYQEVDDKEVYKILRNDLDDFREFISAIIKALL
ncbi:MAG: DUF86 domain-containing protein [Syntrophomonadaceae bacterium]|nr:DUF86 domain-containing protein [Syntrophomonadaceae bacterium]